MYIRRLKRLMPLVILALLASALLLAVAPGGRSCAEARGSHC
jgi:peptidoglycan/LPS O-acetylase OafA/YrhL